MTKFVKMKKRIKETIILIVILMMGLSSIVNAAKIPDQKSTLYDNIEIKQEAVKNNEKPGLFITQKNVHKTLKNSNQEQTTSKITTSVKIDSAERRTNNSDVRIMKTADSDGDDDGGFADGLWGGIVSVFLYILRLIPVVIATGLGKIISTIGALITGTSLASGLTLQDILFNNIELTSIDFFSTSTDNTVNKLRDNVAIWYVAIRNLSVIILAVILLYVGIRMAISSVAEDKARYKHMLANWVTSIALLFVLHYIMEAVIGINNSLVNIMGNASGDSLTTGADNYNNVTNEFAKAAYDPGVSTISGITYALIYLLLCVMTFIFLLTYLKRMITIAFLIMIAPVITITYSIDKMGDGKSQALNAWLKEFIYNILIQPFHCIIFLALVNTSFNMLNTTSDGIDDKLGGAVLAIVMVIFLYQAEDIIKNIFNFKASSMPKTIAQGALFATALNAIGGAAAGAAGGSSKSGGSGSGSSKSPKYANSQGQGNSQTRTTNSQQSQRTETTQRQTSENPQRQRTENTQRQTTENSQRQTTESSQSQRTENQQQSSNTNNNATQTNENSSTQTRNRSGNGKEVARKIGGAVFRNAVKATGYMVGATVGLATGDLNVGISGMKAIGGATSNFMNNQNVKSKQRRLARAYNNFESAHPELDSKSKIAYSRQLLDKEIEPQNDAEREYVRAMTDMSDTYERGGLSQSDAGDKVEKTLGRIQSGDISELSAPQRYYRQASNYFDQRRYRRQRANNTTTDAEETIQPKKPIET